MNNDETPRYLVPHTALDSLRAKVAKLAKKAAKLGVLNCDIAIGEHVATERDGAFFYRLHEVFVTGTVPRVATGHEFVAKLHHMGGAAIVMQPEGAPAMPAHYRTRGSFCDHCNTKRPRHDTFVLRSEAGDYVQVGRSCLADFMPPRDAEAIVALAAYIDSAHDVLSGEESESRGARDQGDMSLETLLAAAVRVVEVEGAFVSRKTAEQYGYRLTSDAAYTLVEAPFHPMAQWAHAAKKAYGFGYLEADSTQRAKARAAMAWAAGLTDEECDGEYLRNLRALARLGFCDRKTIGIAASLPTAYARAMGAIAERKARAQGPAKCHLGTVGGKVSLTVTVLRVVAASSQYGTTFFHVMRDDNGNSLVWRSSGHSYAEGERYALTGTVKEHGEYKGEPQTVLTRCKVVREPAAVAA